VVSEHIFLTENGTPLCAVFFGESEVLALWVDLFEFMDDSP
jgi:hypothetical protein